MSDKTIPAGGYLSADDLPTVIALREQLRALKLLGLVLPEQRRSAVDMERRLSEITATVEFLHATQVRDRHTLGRRVRG